MHEQLNLIFDEVLNAYKNVGIVDLAEYQRELLQNQAFYPPESKNLLLSAPTGTGKNVIIEILTTINVRLTNKKCIFILPYIAAAQEVFFNIQQVWREFGLNVKAHFGAISVSPNEEFDAIICTIEKSAAFINRLLREDRLQDYGCIVIDEIHMLLDHDRGGLLEDILIKLNYYKTTERECPQLLTMSATLENPQLICDFIDAQYIEYTQRLNSLEEFAVVDKKFYKIGGSEQIGQLNPSFNIASDSCGLIGLTIEALIEHKPVLIFCMTKACAEQSAHMISKYIEFCNSKPTSRFPQLKELGISDKDEIDCPSKLKHLLKSGIAYHHSGLSSDDRINIEKLYRQGKIKVIACTSTLSTGVNLPATRVLIRLDQGPLNINYISYNQMIGRCGRVGYDAGQSYIIVQNPQKLADAWRLIKKRQFNQLTRDFTQLLLDTLVIKMVKNEEECEKLISFAIQKPLLNVNGIITHLIKQKFVYSYTTSDNKTLLLANQLSTAASQSFLRPNDALFIFTELEKATKNLCLDTELHLTYLITPLKHKLGIDVGKIPWHKFFNLFDKLPSEYLRVADLLDITQATCAEALNGSPKDTLIRFYMALILMEALQGTPTKEILVKYDFKLADLEVLRDQAVLYARTVVGMCDCLAWPYMKNVLGLFTKKLELWAYPEICDLMKLKGMDGTRARYFIERGITTLQELSIAEPTNVERILRHAVPFLIDSNNNGDQNEWLMNEQINSCYEAAQILIERAQQLTPIAQDIQVINQTNVTEYIGKEKTDEKEELFEDSISQLDKNILLDVTMESIADLSQLTAELSIIEFENDENQQPVVKSKCVDEFLSKCDFIVFEFVDNQFLMMSNNGSKMFTIPLQANSRCHQNCCSTNEMLESFLSSNNLTHKYSYNLSFTFYKAFDLLSNYRLDTKKLTDFYCILSLFKVRLNKCPQTYELLDAELKKLTVSLLSKQEMVSLEKHQLYLTGLTRLINEVLLKSNLNLKPINEFGQSFNQSVLTSISMTYRGFAFDQVQYQKLINFILREIVVVEKAAWKIAGEPFNLHNCKTTRQTLNKLGIPSSGKATTTIAELEHINHPIAPLIVQARRLHHANKVLREIQALVQKDNRIHPYYNCLNSCTGRIFAEQPQIQFVPKENYINGQSCRSVFCAGQENILVSLDFRQLELRMLAALSKDKNLCEMLQKDLDPFENIVLNYPLNRDHKKKVFYALLYGMGKKTLSQELSCTVDEADKVINEMFNYFQGVKEWIENVAKNAMKQGTVQSIWNLSIATNTLNEFEVRQKAPHFIIQASVTQMIRKIMNDVEQSINDDIGLVLQMHDEFLLELKQTRAMEIAQHVKSLMEFQVDGIKFPVKIRWGKNWDALEECCY